MQGKVLELLREAKKDEAATSGYISGEEIADRLGVTRAAVWKHIQALKDAGYSIDSRGRRGYSLTGTPDLLLEQEILPLLSTKVIGKRIFHYDDIPSTNDEAKRLAEEGAPDGSVFVSEAQDAGKGRLSRGWYSPYRKGIWFSVLLRPNFLPQEAAKCTLMAAVAIVRAARMFGADVGIKWPNDVLADGKKLVGTLTEMNASMERINYVVIGTGVNVNLWPSDFPEELRDISTSLAMVKGEAISRISLFAGILQAMDDLYATVRSDGFTSVLDEWRRYSVTLGQEVNVIGIRESFSGRAVDIDSDGALLIESGGRIKKVLAGDVSIRTKGTVSAIPKR